MRKNLLALCMAYMFHQLGQRPQTLEWITHVAIKYDGRVHSLPGPKRHCDVYQKLLRQNNGGLYGPTFNGFLTSHGRYVSRAEAFIIAKRIGQIKKGSRIEGYLYSEDIW